MKFIFSIFYSFLSICCFAQTSLLLQPTFYNTSIQSNSTYPLTPEINIDIQVLRFYISNITFYKGKKKVWEESESYHLVDLNVPTSFNISLETPKKLKYNHLQFHIGIDSLTHEKGAMSGDLDPTKGMYWTWQTGYINYKIEGNYFEKGAEGKEYIFHIGGYQGNQKTLQTVFLKCKKKKPISIKVAIDQFFSTIKLTENRYLMSPGKKAVQLAKCLPQLFNIQK